MSTASTTAASITAQSMYSTELTAAMANRQMASATQVKTATDAATNIESMKISSIMFTSGVLKELSSKTER
jgi:hypothetical protein